MGVVGAKVGELVGDILFSARRRGTLEETREHRNVVDHGVGGTAKTVDLVFRVDLIKIFTFSARRGWLLSYLAGDWRSFRSQATAHCRHNRE